jgi:hypothetical protein
VLGLIGEIATLAAGESVTLTAPYTAGTQSVTNTVDVCGIDALGKPVCDEDDHDLTVLRPAITLDKKVNGGDHG